MSGRTVMLGDTSIDAIRRIIIHGYVVIRSMHQAEVLLQELPRRIRGSLVCYVSRQSGLVAAVSPNRDKSELFRLDIEKSLQRLGVDLYCAVEHFSREADGVTHGEDSKRDGPADNS